MFNVIVRVAQKQELDAIGELYGIRRRKNWLLGVFGIRESDKAFRERLKAGVREKALL